LPRFWWSLPESLRGPPAVPHPLRILLPLDEKKKRLQFTTNIGSVWTKCSTCTAYPCGQGNRFFLTNGKLSKLMKIEHPQEADLKPWEFNPRVSALPGFNRSRDESHETVPFSK
jgi:hypothetical protein